MSSPGQKRGSCSHAMASFDGHSFCARCHEKGKGKDTCVENPSSDCEFCLSLTPEQKAQLATPSYKLKKEKRDAKKSELSSPVKDGTFVDPAIVSVLGVVNDPHPTSSPPDKKPREEMPSTSKVKKPEKSTADKKMEELDQKWSDRFNRLEALLMSKTFPPTFSSAVKVTPSHSPPASIAKDNEPFFLPTLSERTGQDSSALQQSARQLTSQHSDSTERTGQGFSALHQPSSQLRSDPQLQEFSLKRTVSDSSAEKHQSASQLSSNRARPKPLECPSTNPAPAKHQTTGQTASHRPSSYRPSSTVTTDTGSPQLHRHRRDSASSYSSEASSELSDRPPVDLYAAEGELSDDQELTVNEPDQTPSAEQTYRETMRGIRSYMGWTSIPDIDSSNTASDDNPFSGPKAPVPGKVSVTMPTEEWLCKELSKLNIILTEGYPTRSSDLQSSSKLQPLSLQSTTEHAGANENYPNGGKREKFSQGFLCSRRTPVFDGLQCEYHSSSRKNHGALVGLWFCINGKPHLSPQRLVLE